MMSSELLHQLATLRQQNAQLEDQVASLIHTNSILVHTNSILENAINSISDPIFVKDRQHRWVLVNHAMCEYIGRDQSELLGKSDPDVFPKEQANAFWAKDEVVFETESENFGEESITDSAGHLKIISTKKNCFRHAGNSFLVGMFRDITEQKQVESDLQHAKEALEHRVEVRTIELQQTVAQLEQEIRDRTLVEAEIRHQKQRLSSLFEQSPLAIIEWSSTFEVVSWNRAAEAIFGYRADEAIGQNVVDLLVPPSAKVSVDQVIAELLAASGGTHSINQNVTKDGRTIVCEWHNKFLIDDRGRTIGALSMTQDITERQQAEQTLKQALQESEYQSYLLRTIVDTTVDWVFVKDQEFHYLLANRTYADAIGKTPVEILGKTDEELGFANELIFGNPSQGVRGFRTDDRAVLTGQIIRNPHDPATIADGSLRIFDSRKVPLRNVNGDIFAILGISHDITERVQAEDALRRKTSELQAVFQALPDLYFRMDWSGTILEFKAGAASNLYVPPEEFLGKRMPDYLPLEIGKQFGQALRQVHQMRSLVSIEYDLLMPEGKQSFEARILPLGDTQLIAIIRDISPRKRAEAALQAQEQFLRSIYEGVEHLIVVHDVLEADEIQYSGWNPSTERATGLRSSDIAGKTPEAVFGPVEGATVRHRCKQCLQTEKLITYEETRTFQGQESWWLTTLNPLKDANGKIYRLVETSFNISDRKQTEQALQRSEAKLRQQAQDLEQTLRELRRTQAQLIQSEKMSSLGQLVAGVAHEINNPVNFIYGNLMYANDYTQDLLKLIRLYRQHYPTSNAEIETEATAIDLDFLMEDLPKLVASMKVGADRIQKIVTSLRNFSRMDEAEFKAVNLHEGIDSTLMILQNRLKPKHIRGAGVECLRPEIALIKEYGNLPLVECFAGQLNQVFMNILSNAIDALEEKDAARSPQEIQNNPGSIRISTKLLSPDRVEIRIADTGGGISDDVRQRLFDPFFTTKPLGKGTGMGLSISYQIVTERHGGLLQCQSTLNQGTDFVIEIPVCQSVKAKQLRHNG